MSGCRWEAHPPASRATRSAGHPSYRGCLRAQTRFDLGTVSNGGVYSPVAPTLWLPAPQCAAPGSARAGGGCYARNVRVSGSPSGSKRTTNNLSARRPPPPSASSRSRARPPPSSREAALRLAAGLASALSPCHPGLWRQCCNPCLLHSSPSCWGGVLTNSAQDRPTADRARFSPFIPASIKGDLQRFASRAPLVAAGGVSGVLVMAGGLQSSPHPPSFDHAAGEQMLRLAAAQPLSYFTPQRQTLNCTFIVYKHRRQLS